LEDCITIVAYCTDTTEITHVKVILVAVERHQVLFILSETAAPVIQ